SPVLLLDEPTSGVDSHTEAAIVEALGRLQEGRTVIVISHRPSAVAQCSAMLRIEHGRIVADTSKLAAPPSAPPRLASARREEMLLAHPAVQAWRRLNPERVLPERITPAKFKANKTRSHLTVYRLQGLGPEGEAVIAKRWVHGEKYDVERPDHRAAAARWLGVLHTEACGVAGRAGLPDAGPRRYRDQMRATRDAVRNHLHNPAFSHDDLAFLDELLEQFDEL